MFNDGNPPSSSGMTEVSSSTSALKDYWMQPAVLNELFTIATEDYGAVDLNIYDFILGTYQGVSAQYNIIFEPLLTRQVNYQLVSYTFRDAMMFPSYLMENETNALKQLQLQIWWNLTSAMELEDEQTFLVTPDGYLGQNGFNWPDDTASLMVQTGSDLSNTLGIGVITSPAVGVIPTSVIPQVIKTYVQVVGIDADGNFEYEYIGEPTVENLDSEDPSEDYLVLDGEQTNVPLATQDTSEEVTLVTADGKEVTGTAILNDMITTPISSNCDTSQITWINEDLPVVNGTQIEASGKDVVDVRSISFYFFCRFLEIKNSGLSI